MRRRQRRQVLPQTIFPDTLYWVVPAAVLLIMRVRGYKVAVAERTDAGAILQSTRGRHGQTRSPKEGSGNAIGRGRSALARSPGGHRRRGLSAIAQVLVEQGM